MERIKQTIIIDEWQKVLKHAWSIRFAIIAGIFAAAEVVLPIFSDALPRGLFAGLSGLATIGSIISRVILQKKMHYGDE